MSDQKNEIQKNAITYTNELKWLTAIIQARLENHFSKKSIDAEQIRIPILNQDSSKYAQWILTHKLNDFERLIIVAALANIYSPYVFDKFLIKNKGLDKRFTEFGGKVDSSNSRFTPTLETLTFIFFGSENGAKFEVFSLFDFTHVFNQKNIIRFGNKKETDSHFSRTVNLTEESLQYFTLGTSFKPDYSSDFPAKSITTKLTWDGLVLSPIIADEVENINAWLAHKQEIEQNPILEKKLNRGYKCLFYGPPGTGKTLTASLLGKRNKRDVYRIDLSQIVSKYVGETEKNLAHIFNIAEDKDWILFFDEAESLFSKRTSVSDSKDKFANQQTAYLLQRMEEYKGLIILATNLRPNIDIAFSRRLQSVIHFTLPDYNERKILWKNSLDGISNLSTKVIDKLSKEYPISGGSIKNVIHFAWLLSKRNKTSITENEIIYGIRRELGKDGKSLITN